MICEGARLIEVKTTKFTPNYPTWDEGRHDLLTTPERLRASHEYTGRGVVMAFIDAGFSNHPDIKGRVRVHVDASTAEIKEQPRVMRVTPASWHGQMTSVIAAGDGHNAGGIYRGLACEAELVLIKVATPQMRLKEIDILRGLNWLLGHHRRFDVRVVNISVGGDYVSDDPGHPLHRAIRDLVELGMIVTIAAGNQGADHLLPPASAPDAITIGGYDDKNTLDRRHWRAYNSNYGRSYDGTLKPDLVAPARWIASPILPDSQVAHEMGWLAPLLHDFTGDVLANLLENGRDDVPALAELDADAESAQVQAVLQGRINHHKVVNAHYQHVDGTSVAAPIVASVIAQMLEANPHLTPAEVKAILRMTAGPLGHIKRERQGAGALNATRAVRAAEQFRR